MFDAIPSNVTLAGLLNFVQNRKGDYNYTDQNNCALAQYLKSLGYECFISYEHFRARGKNDSLWRCYRINDIANGLSVALECPPRQNTWASLSKRILALN